MFVEVGRGTIRLADHQQEQAQTEPGNRHQQPAYRRCGEAERPEPVAVTCVERRSGHAHQDGHQGAAACLQGDQPRRLGAESRASADAARMKLGRQAHKQRNAEVTELVDEDCHRRQ
jgi:hypothetical protein